MVRYLTVALCLGALLLLLIGCGKKEAASPGPTNPNPNRNTSVTPGAVPSGIESNAPQPAGLQSNAPQTPSGVESNAPQTAGGVTLPTSSAPMAPSSAGVAEEERGPLSSSLAQQDAGMKNAPADVPKDANGMPMTRAKRLQQMREQGGGAPLAEPGN